jgi:hypothetical protein
VERFDGRFLDSLTLTHNTTHTPSQEAVQPPLLVRHEVEELQRHVQPVVVVVEWLYRLMMEEPNNGPRPRSQLARAAAAAAVAAAPAAVVVVVAAAAAAAAAAAERAINVLL